MRFWLLVLLFSGGVYLQTQHPEIVRAILGGGAPPTAPSANNGSVVLSDPAQANPGPTAGSGTNPDPSSLNLNPPGQDVDSGRVVDDSAADYGSIDDYYFGRHLLYIDEAGHVAGDPYYLQKYQEERRERAEQHHWPDPGPGPFRRTNTAGASSPSREEHDAPEASHAPGFADSGRQSPEEHHDFEPFHDGPKVGLPAPESPGFSEPFHDQDPGDGTHHGVNELAPHSDSPGEARSFSPSGSQGYEPHGEEHPPGGEMPHGTGSFSDRPHEQSSQAPPPARAASPPPTPRAAPPPAPAPAPAPVPTSH